MEPERWMRLRAVLEELVQLTGEERARRIEELEPDLRPAVEQLLAWDVEGGIEAPADR